jgi:DNA-binding PadR family transcriptional regulator
MLRYIVLGLLRDGIARHGYALLTDYRHRSGIRLSTGNFYRELQRLTFEGLVRTMQNPQDADSRRAPYQITEEGIATFDGWLCDAEVRLGEPHEDELSVRSLFFGYAPHERVIEALDGWYAALWLQVKSLERAQRVALPDDPSANRPFAALPHLLSRRQKYITADLEFVAELRRGYVEWTEAQRIALETLSSNANRNGKRRRTLGGGNGRPA